MEETPWCGYIDREFEGRMMLMKDGGVIMVMLKVVIIEGLRV